MVFYQVPCVFNVLVTILYHFCTFAFFLLLPKREGKDYKGGSKISKSYCPSEMPSLFLKDCEKKDS